MWEDLIYVCAKFGDDWSYGLLFSFDGSVPEVSEQLHFW